MRAIPLFIALTALGVAPPVLAEPPATISSSASAHGAVAADRARIQASTASHAGSAAEAAADVRRMTSSVLQSLKALGLHAEVLQSTGYTVAPDTNYETNKVTGYGAMATLVVDTDDVTNVGRILDVLLSSGVNEVSEVSFSSAREEEAHATALKAAVALATRRAAAMAEAAGGHLGDLLELSTEPRGTPTSEVITVTGSLRGVAGTSLPPPEVQVTAVVYATWRYLPGSK